mgnify:CR=1 FL=1
MWEPAESSPSPLAGTALFESGSLSGFVFGPLAVCFGIATGAVPFGYGYWFARLTETSGAASARPLRIQAGPEHQSGSQYLRGRTPDDARTEVTTG